MVLMNKSGYIDENNPASVKDVNSDDLLTAIEAIQAATEGDPAVTVVAYSGSKAASGDNTVVAAPAAGSRLVLISWGAQNTTAVSTTAKFTAGAGGTEIDAKLLPNQGAGFSQEPLPLGREYRLPEATALVMNLSAANAHNVQCLYFVEVV